MALVVVLLIVAFVANSLADHDNQAIGELYLTVEGESLNNSSFIDINRIVPTDGVQCSVSGHTIRNPFLEEDESGSSGIIAYWISPTNRVVERTNSIDVRYRRGSVYLEFQGLLSITEGVYTCVSELPLSRGGLVSTDRVVYVGLYLSEGEYKN